MVRKLIPMLLILLMLPLAGLAEAQVLDRAGLFSAAEIADMEQIISRTEQKHQIDLVVLTTHEVPYDYSDSMWKVRNYADDFYDMGGYGMGEDFSGMLILLDMNNRVMWLSTGGVMIEYINDAREEDILDLAYSYLVYDAYGDAVIAALSRTEQLMEKGRAEGTFLYDEATGKRIGGIYNALTTGEIGMALLLAGAAAVVFYLSISGAYHLKGSTYTYDRAANASVNLTQDEATYIRQFVRRTPRSTGTHGGGGRSGGGSGVHRSSSGRSHGGGGRRF